MNQTTKQAIGNAGEQMVVAWLEQQGYTLVCRNYKKKLGEIDLIVRNKTTLCFVEVKTRNAPLFAMSDVMVPAKRRKIIITAQQFLASYPHEDLICRFDVAFVRPAEQEPITYIPNAFCLSEELP